MTLSLRLPTSLHEEAKAVAAREERSLAQLIRYALKLYLEAGK